MTISLSKTFMTLSLVVVSMISPADAQTLVWSQAIGSSKFTCNTDSNKSPYADCLYSMAKICNTTDPTWDSTKKANCQTGVNMMFASMRPDWQAVRRDCGQWPFTLTQNGQTVTYTGVFPSTKCDSANSNLIAYGYYIQQGVRTRVTSRFTYAQNTNLWSKVKA